MFTIPLALFLIAAAVPADRLVLDGKGKHIVFVSGDEEYRSEESLPALARILNQHHGFRCTVLYAIDPKSGEINPDIQTNIPGLENLESADLMVIATRFRNLPDEQMKYIDQYLARGGPIVALRTATHAFALDAKSAYRKYSWNNKEGDWEGGFGRQILGETWIRHHGKHAVQSSRGILVQEQSKHPILRGVKDIWGPADVYAVRLPLPGDSLPLVMGQVLSGMQPTDSPADGPVNSPMMPVAWTKSYGPKSARVFVTTMGAATDLSNEGVRRMVVNGVFWALKQERRIKPDLNIAFVREYKPTNFKFGGYIRGLKPGDR
jgi:type 1 glutamine amidotransferase